MPHVLPAFDRLTSISTSSFLIGSSMMSPRTFNTGSWFENSLLNTHWHSVIITVGSSLSLPSSKITSFGISLNFPLGPNFLIASQNFHWSLVSYAFICKSCSFHIFFFLSCMLYQIHSAYFHISLFVFVFLSLLLWYIFTRLSGHTTMALVFVVYFL